MSTEIISFSGQKTDRQRRIIEDEKNRAEIVKSASKKDLAKLTARERAVLQLLYPQDSSKAGKRTLEQIGRKYHVTREAIRQSRDNAINKLEKIGRGETVGIRHSFPRIEMDSEIMEKLLSNKGQPLRVLSKLIGHSEEVTVRFRNKLNIPQSPRGRPRTSH